MFLWGQPCPIPRNKAPGSPKILGTSLLGVIADRLSDAAVSDMSDTRDYLVGWYACRSILALEAPLFHHALETRSPRCVL